MKKVVLLMSLAGVAGLAQAAEYGRVISTVPVVQQVSVPQQSCWDEQVQVQQPRTYGGALLGGIFGGLLGNTVGKGNGNVAATAAGAVVGALAGDNIANQNAGVSTQTVHRCATTQTQQQRTVGYDVTYEYAGQRYTTRMAYDPGRQVPVSIGVDGGSPPPAQTAPVTTTTYVDQPQTVVVQQPQVVYQTAPVVVAAPLVYPALSINYGYYRGWGGGWGWRGGYWHH
ncbi:glycine zipper 2TM domain-containing protein [Silvimonas iriomotensis]|uniref:Glycine zipper 2TM domain-containing protein n=1 Tax=Silvimonas iriomotensis TaxID=449662 RepID=A0ABQ2PEH6_9NEIS|nr:glycine zipper 2TM domain-containing protein [Silvimonas iriomotensis]GGP23665.1 hypothetical protein GCM10010970_36650 [Silvimonas iriomotensis]